ncbi:hypothetical protein LguiA_009707 [Lonicera macranthoides]
MAKKMKKKEEFEFCALCRLNHDQGRRHNFFPKHKKSLSSFLSRFQSKLSDIRYFLINPSLLRPEHASRNRLWCVFCDSDIDEVGSFFACANAINHLASVGHLKNLKGFLWKYGAGMDRLDSFCISEADLAKWEKRCKSLKTEAAGEGSCGVTIGPSNDIHNELKSEYVDTFDKNNIQFLNSSFSNGVEPLQNYTNEKYPVSHSKQSRVTEAGPRLQDANSYLLAGTPFDTSSWGSSNVTGYQDIQHSISSNRKECSAAGCVKNGVVYKEDQSGANGESSSLDLHNVTQISSRVREETTGNVHSGAPPPWLDSSGGSQLDVRLKPGVGMSGNIVSPVSKSGKSSKLNPKRVGAAWAERRKIEMEMEKRGEIVANSFDANWLPNFGRVWQSGSRKESMKEFGVESEKCFNVESQAETIKLQPYISKRMRRDGSE